MDGGSSCQNPPCLGASDPICATEPPPECVPPEETQLGHYCQIVADAVTDALDFYPLPDHLMVYPAVRTREELDINSIFLHLDRLELEPGRVLDYVYDFDGMGGRPILYVRDEAAIPFATVTELIEARGDYWTSTDDVMAEIHADGTGEGFIQLALFWLLGNQFYIYWHSNYGRREVVCSRFGAEAQALMIEEEVAWGSDRYLDAADRIRRLDVNPYFERDGDRVELSIVAFWLFGGANRLTIEAMVEHPHGLEQMNRVNVVAYDPGFMY